jgi:hypothetical protein
MALKFGGSKSHQHDCLSILGPKGQRRYTPESFSTIGPSNANFVMASATSHDAASASILSFAETFSLPAIRTRRRYALVSPSCRIRSSSASLSLYPAQPVAACHVQMPAIDSSKTTARIPRVSMISR